MLALNILSGTSLFNSAYVMYAWYYWIVDNWQAGVTDYWRAWFGAFFVQGFLWVPLTLSWPALPTMGPTGIKV